MSYQTVYFHDAKKIIGANRMTKIIKQTFEGIEQDLVGSSFPGTTLKTTLTDCDWREDSDSLKIIDGRRYQYKGFRKRIAIEANLSCYEFLWEGLFRLQIGFDKGLIDVGILILNGTRSDKSPLGESIDLVKSEIEELFPTISLPVVVALFDVGVVDYSEDNVDAVSVEFSNNDDFNETDEIITGVAV